MVATVNSKHRPISSCWKSIFNKISPSTLRRIIWISVGGQLTGWGIQLMILPHLISQDGVFLPTTTSLRGRDSSNNNNNNNNSNNNNNNVKATVAASILPLFLVQSFTNGTHHPEQQRTVLTFTTVPAELFELAAMVEEMLLNQTFHIFDAIHINIPWVAMRFRNESFPHTQDIIQLFPDDPRVIINRLMDYGPMTRYFGALGYEQHPDTIIIAFDVDTDEGRMDTLSNLVRASRELDPDAIWCTYGEDFMYVNDTTIVPYWDTYEPHLSDDRSLAWTQVYFCRAARGFLIKPKFFANFVLNASDYHSSCFWDDDRFLSFQMAVMGIERKIVHTGEWYTNDHLPEMQRRKEECANGGAAIVSQESELKQETQLIVEQGEEPGQAEEVVQEQLAEESLYEQQAEDVQQDEQAEGLPQEYEQIKDASPEKLAEQVQQERQVNELPQYRRRQLGSLTEVNVANKADVYCTVAYLKTHPHLFPLAYNITERCP